MFSMPTALVILSASLPITAAIVAFSVRHAIQNQSAYSEAIREMSISIAEFGVKIQHLTDWLAAVAKKVE